MIETSFFRPDSKYFIEQCNLHRLRYYERILSSSSFDDMESHSWNLFPGQKYIENNFYSVLDVVRLYGGEKKSEDLVSEKIHVIFLSLEAIIVVFTLFNRICEKD